MNCYKTFVGRREPKLLMRMLFLIGCTVVTFTIISLHYQPNIKHFLEYHDEGFSVAPVDLSYDNPFRYSHRVDFRVIVLTFNRPKSLEILLESLHGIQTDGDTISIEIWIDRNSKNEVHNETLEVAVNFSKINNHTKIHLHSHQVGLYGQWLFTYSTKHLLPGEEEIVLFLEDDLTISKHSYRWLKKIHELYQHHSDYLGTGLRNIDPTFPLRTKIPQNETVFMYRIFPTHGFSPKSSVWNNFQKWFLTHFDRKTFKPYVPNIKPTSWYKSFEKSNKTRTMWSIWFLYYTYAEQLFAVYLNNDFYKNYFNTSSNFCFLVHRQETGLHFKKKSNATKENCKLIETWSDDFVQFPNVTSKFNWDGSRH